MKIISKPEEICKDHYLIKIDASGIDSSPGQFVNIRIGEQTDPLLRRPFSIHNHKDGVMEIAFKVIGKGTKLLRDHLKPGEIDIIAPLGKGFTLIEGGKTLIIGGGVGNAPLYYLGKSLKERNNHVTYLYGATSKDAIFHKERFDSIANQFIIATDDGSEGEKGFITAFASKNLVKNDFDFVYACGPGIMLKKMVALLDKKNIPVEVSIEKYFGCGIGVCSGCTVETIDGLKRACVDGPVFNGRDINWDYDQNK